MQGGRLEGIVEARDTQVARNFKAAVSRGTIGTPCRRIVTGKNGGQRRRLLQHEFGCEVAHLFAIAGAQFICVKLQTGLFHRFLVAAETMEELEQEILAQLGIPDPYAERMD